MRVLKPALVRLKTRDDIEMSGLLYEPRRKSRRAVVYLHGTGGASVFDSKRVAVLAEELTGRRMAWFPFNNRGAHVVTKPRLGGGCAHELIRDCVHDIDAAVAFLRKRGYDDITLAGHSTGANKIAVYDFYKKRNPVRRYILLGGGDDTGLIYDHWGPRKFQSVLKRARERRHGGELVPGPIDGFPISWRALYDMMNPDGDYNVFPFLEAFGKASLSRKPLFRHLQGVRKPTLVVYGEKDEFCFGDVSRCVAVLADAIGPKPNFEFAVMKDADHGFEGYETELASFMADWISGS